MDPRPLSWLAKALLLDDEVQAAAFASEAGFLLDEHGCFSARKVRLKHKTAVHHMCMHTQISDQYNTMAGDAPAGLSDAVAGSADVFWKL